MKNDGFNTPLKIIADNIKTLITGDYKKGDTDLNTLWNITLFFLDRRGVSPSLKGVKKLSKGQKSKALRYYSPYIKRISDRYHRIYTAKSGRFSPRYMPADVFYMYVDRYLSDRKAAIYLDNKCYYYRLFSNVKLPEAVALRIGDTWLDSGLKPIPYKAVRSIVKNEDELVVKEAYNSEGGHGVTFIEGEKLCREFKERVDELICDVVIQRPIKQHAQMAALHPQSVNTLRIVSLLTKDKIQIYAVCVRIGVGEARMDNGWQGGIFCAVRPDGSLKEYGVRHDGTRTKTHPDLGYSFADKRIPHLAKAIRLVKKAHAFMGHFRLVAWDIAIDEKGEAVLVEANLTMGAINEIQICNGPLFKKDTDKILSEVFKGRRRVTTLL